MLYDTLRHVSSIHSLSHSFLFFIFNTTATTEIYTLSLHDALPISRNLFHAHNTNSVASSWNSPPLKSTTSCTIRSRNALASRSEEHTSELQSHSDLVCRLLLEKKKKKKNLPTKSIRNRQQHTHSDI